MSRRLGPGRRALAWAIRGYRRHLSGRGPLRNVTCSFHAAESCSAYGLRATEELAGSTREALALIGRRLRTCGDVALVRFPDTLDRPRGALAWGPLHDRPIAEVAATLDRGGERADSCAFVMASRAAVARWRGDGVDLVRCRLALERLAVPVPRLVVRPGPATLAWLRRRITRRAAAGALVGALALLAFSGPAAIAALVAVALATAAATTRARRRLRSYRRQVAVAELARPGWPTPSPSATTPLATMEA